MRKYETLNPKIFTMSRDSKTVQLAVIKVTKITFDIYFYLCYYVLALRIQSESDLIVDSFSARVSIKWKIYYFSLFFKKKSITSLQCL